MVFEITLPNGHKMYTDFIVRYSKSEPIQFRAVNIKDIENSNKEES